MDAAVTFLFQKMDEVRVNEYDIKRCGISTESNQIDTEFEENISENYRSWIKLG